MGTEEHSFDSLARGLASGNVSRRKALRLLGGILAGTVLASVPGIALTQRAAEAAPVRPCRNASACCACTYVDATTGAIISSTCETEVGHRCGGRRIQSFFNECAERCAANQPAGTGTRLTQACEGQSNFKEVCRQEATGEKVCMTREC
jgi:hypothetical protein